MSVPNTLTSHHTHFALTLHTTLLASHFFISSPQYLTLFPHLSHIASHIIASSAHFALTQHTLAHHTTHFALTNTPLTLAHHTTHSLPNTFSVMSTQYPIHNYNNVQCASRSVCFRRTLFNTLCLTTSCYAFCLDAMLLVMPHNLLL